MLKIYGNLKSLVLGDELPTNLTKAFDAMIDKESKVKSAREIQFEKRGRDILVNNAPIGGSRIVGSLESVAESELENKETALKSIGYESEAIQNVDGSYNVMYFIKKTPDVERAINLQRHEIEEGDLGVRETKELGKYYGYTAEQTKTYTDLWKAKIQALKEKEQYYEGETYTSPYRDPDSGEVMGGKNVWRVKGREGNAITLELIGGKLFKLYGGTTAAVTVEENKLAKAGFVKEKVKRIGKPRGLGVAQEIRKAKKPSTEEYLDEDATEAEMTKFIEEQGGDVIQFGVEQQFAEAQAAVPTQETIQTPLLEEDESSNATPPNMQIVNYTEQLDPETYQSEVQRLKEIEDAANAERQSGNIELADKLDAVVKGLREGNPNVQAIVGLDPDVDLPDGTLLVIPPEIRQSHYDELGLTKEEGDKLTDDQLENMLKNKLGLYFQDAIPGMTKDQVRQFKRDGEKSNKRMFGNSLNEELKASGIIGEALRRARDKVFLFLGMKQALARYQPVLFGRIFHTVNDLIRLSNEKVSQLLSPKWGEITHANYESKVKVANALKEGTLYKEGDRDNLSVTPRPVKPWKEWESIKDYADIHTEAEVAAERQRRKEAREKWKSENADWIAKFGNNYSKFGKVWTGEELRKKFGMSDKEIEMYFTARNTLDGATTLMKNAAIAYGMTAKEADSKFGGVGYTPLDRGTGAWALFFPDETSETGYNYTRFKSLREAQKARSRLIDDGTINPTDTATQIHRASESVNFKPNLITLDSMLDYVESAGIPIGELENHPDVEKIMKEIKKRTYTGQRLIRRGNANLIVDPDVLFEVIETFVERASRRYSRSLANTRIEGLVRAVPKSSVWSRFAREYVNMSFTPPSGSEQTWGKIRRAGFLWHLAWNVSNAMINLTQPAITTVPFLLEKKWGLRINDVNSVLLEATKGGLAYAFERELPQSLQNQHPGLKTALDEWKSKAVVTPTLAEQLAGIYGCTEELIHTL